MVVSIICLRYMQQRLRHDGPKTNVLVPRATESGYIRRSRYVVDCAFWRRRSIVRRSSVIRKALNLTFKTARRIAIAVVGATVLFIGLVMIVTPGPAIVVVPVGLAILGAEFAWARHWLRRLRETISDQSANGRAKRAAAHRDRTAA